jgi:hypothetical protein
MSLRTRSECLHAFTTAAVSAASNLMVSGVTGTRIYVYRTVVTVLNAGTIQFAADAAPISQAFQVAADGALVLDTPLNMEPWYITPVSVGNNNSLNLLQTGVAALCFDVWYLQGP